MSDHDTYEEYQDTLREVCRLIDGHAVTASSLTGTADEHEAIRERRGAMTEQPTPEAERDQLDRVQELFDFLQGMVPEGYHIARDFDAKALARVIDDEKGSKGTINLSRVESLQSELASTRGDLTESRKEIERLKAKVTAPTPLASKLHDLAREVAELESQLNTRDEAAMRAIQRHQAIHGATNWPDREDLIVWLMKTVTAADQAALARARKAKLPESNRP